MPARVYEGYMPARVYEGYMPARVYEGYMPARVYEGYNNKIGQVYRAAVWRLWVYHSKDSSNEHTSDQQRIGKLKSGSKS